jgi:hypothetical protein
VLPLLAVAACGQSRAARPGAAPAVSPSPAGAASSRGATPRTAAGRAAPVPGALANAPGARPPGSAASAGPGARTATASAAPVPRALATLDSLLITAADMGHDWQPSQMESDANDPNVRHQYCHEPFRTDAQRVGRREHDVAQDETQHRVQEEIDRYRPGGAKAALAEFREAFASCRTYAQGTAPNDFTVSMEPTDGVNKVGEDSVSMAVRYTAGPFVVYSVLTVAVQGDLLIVVSSVAEKPENAMAVAQQAVPTAARVAKFRH